MWYLKPFVSSERSLNKSLMLNLITSNCDKGSFLSINSTFYVIPYPLNALPAFTTLNSS